MGTDKLEKGTEMLKKRLKRQRFGIKWAVVAILIGVGLSTAILGLFFYNVSKWYDTNRVTFQEPVIIRPPVLITKREIKPSVIVITPEPKDERTAEINEIYRKIRYIESGAGMGKGDGVHAYCQNSGQVNEVGYLLNGKRTFCFADYGEQWETVRNWFTKRLATMSLDEALCVWNTGTKQPQCLYSQKFHSL